jgi:gamma-glutamylcyclotransferase (GGCT)/AIG2-like uncharacterized protein YtfP
MERLFVYGTLRFPRFQKPVFGKTIPGAPVTLRGFRKTKKVMPDGRYFVILPDKKHSVRGLILSVSKSELKRADRWELGYHRIRVHAGGLTEWAYAPKHEKHKEKTGR